MNPIKCYKFTNYRHITRFIYKIYVFYLNSNTIIFIFHYYGSSLGERGSGAGKGGGGGGTIREAGGSFGKREAAQEDEYFYRQQKEQMAKLKNSLSDEISFHEEQIQRHKEAIERNKKRVEELGNNN